MNSYHLYNSPRQISLSPSGWRPLGTSRGRAMWEYETQGGMVCAFRETAFHSAFSWQCIWVPWLRFRTHFFLALFDHVWRFLFKVVFLSCLNYHSLILITPCQLLRKFWSREEATFAGQAGVGRVTDAVTHHSHAEFTQACLSTWAGDDVILQCFSAGAQNILTWVPRIFQKGHR